MANKITKIRKIKINKFRGLSEIDIDFANRITIICGKNGTSKSTILGIVAQVFSFRRDYSQEDEGKLDFRTLQDTRFESLFSDHFRLSEKFDVPGSMDINFEVYDGAFDQELTNLSLGLYDTAGRVQARPIVRGNKVEGVKNESRNVTHPVIYLSLARLLPITARTDYKTRDVDYLIENSKYFRQLNNRLLKKSTSNLMTATTGTVKSIVAHSEKYDQESVSVGEDNTGQILQAILSFKRLKETYPDYHGGILLIDEADAGLFPAAQVEFVKLLSSLTKELSLQVVLTSHSPTMIEEVHALSLKSKNDYKTIYLSDSYGPIRVMENISWVDIHADLKVETIAIKHELLPKVNIYFEDKQGYDFYKAIIKQANIKRVTNDLKEINMSCSDLINLASRKIPEFTEKSIIVFDADVRFDKNISKIKSSKNICFLPTELPPDQLLFEFLYNLDKEDLFWINENRFTKPVFESAASNIIETLSIETHEGQEFSLKQSLEDYRNTHENYGGVIRDLFKRFATHNDIEKMVNGKVVSNPYRYWASRNPEIVAGFVNKFVSCLGFVLDKGYGVERGKFENIIKP